MKLAGRQALITGASRGFGRHLAQTFWREGASLLLVARTAADLEMVQRNLGPAAPGQTIQIFAQDLTLPTAVEKIATEVERSFGGVDVLINNAGNQGTIGPLWENDLAQWEYSLRLNLLVPAALCRAAEAERRIDHQPVRGRRDRTSAKLLCLRRRQICPRAPE
jgi:NAD(P)-dependent dehydrogenase (short-subunit alcohol dehydrogenase family)